MWKQNVCKREREKEMWIVFNACDYVNENKTEHNPNWPYIPDHPYRILIIEGKRIIKFNKQPARYR